MQTYTSALLSVWDAPRASRRAIEDAIAQCLRSEPPLSTLAQASQQLWQSDGDSPALQLVSNPVWEAAFLTWEVTHRAPIHLGCTEVLVAEKEEMEVLETELATCATQQGFSFSLMPLDEAPVPHPDTIGMPSHTRQ